MRASFRDHVHEDAAVVEANIAHLETSALVLTAKGYFTALDHAASPLVDDEVFVG